MAEIKPVKTRAERHMPASGGRLLSVTEATHEGHVWVLPGLGGG